MKERDHVLKSLNMSIKLPVVIVGLCLFVGASISVFAFTQSRATLLGQADQRLSLLMMERASQLERWSQTMIDDLRGYGADPTVQEALVAFTNTHRLLNGDPTEILQRVYITENPNPPGEKDALVEPAEAHPFHMQHANFHPFFRSLKDTDGYYDIFLFSPNGNLLYSVYKEPDFATNFVEGPFADSGLGRAFQSALTLEPGQLAIEGFTPYAPSADAPAAFVATPVIGEWGDVIGVFAIQLPVDIIKGILGNDAGLGETGEILAVGPDGRTRSESRFVDGPDMLSPYLDEARLAAFDKEPEAFLVNVSGHRSISVVTLAQPVDVLGLGWRLVAEMSMAEVLAPTIELRNIMILIGLVGVSVAGLFGILFARSVTGPLAGVGVSMQAVADRQKDIEVSGVDRGDEIGTIARILVGFRDSLDAADRAHTLQEAQHKEQEHVVDRLNIALNALAEGDLTQEIRTPFSSEFEALRNNYNRSLAQLSQTVSTLISNASSIDESADQIARSSNDLMQRTENQAATLEETAAALDQLTSGVRTAATSLKEVEGIVAIARTDAENSEPIVKEAVSAMKEIETSSGAITQIIDVINDIAFQTNLLALNAGVEAARAGEAGRGFAVVASEVRALAQRSTDASKQIKGLIDSSSAQVDKGASLVTDAGSSLTNIIERISHISKLMSEIAEGAEEQSTSLVEINVGVSSLDKVTQQNASMVEMVNRNSENLNNGAMRLAEVAGQFTISAEGHLEEAA